MHARMTVAHAQPDRFDEAVATVEESFLPDARDRPGYQGFLLLTDPTRQQLIGISFWENEADLQQTGDSGGYYQQRMNSFAELLVSPATTTTHAVAVREP